MASLTTFAQDSVDVVRPVTSVFTADVGYGSLHDTYLTPVTYHGLNVRLGWEHFQATGFNPEKWVRELELGADYQLTHNPAGNHTMHALMAEGRWSMMHRWRGVFSPKLQFMVGPMTQFRGGILYNSNNSNNVVNAKIHWAVGVNAMAVYNTHLWSTPVALRYEASLPLLGVFFSPDYDEAYYEIYVGNHSGLVHFGYPGNRFDMTNYLTADFRLGGTTLRVGYRGRIEASKVSGNITKIFTHSFVIGIGGEFFSLSPRKKLSNKARTISAMYEQ